MDKKVGHYAFLGGFILAVLAGLIPALQTAAVIWVIIVLGLIVGFLNITEKESTEFLIATIALLLVGTAGLSAVPTVGGFIDAILKNIVAFAALHH